MSHSDSDGTSETNPYHIISVTHGSNNETINNEIENLMHEDDCSIEELHFIGPPQEQQLFLYALNQIYEKTKDELLPFQNLNKISFHNDFVLKLPEAKLVFDIIKECMQMTFSLTIIFFEDVEMSRKAISYFATKQKELQGNINRRSPKMEFRKCSVCSDDAISDVSDNAPFSLSVSSLDFPDNITFESQGQVMKTSQQATSLFQYCCEIAKMTGIHPYMLQCSNSTLSLEAACCLIAMAGNKQQQEKLQSNDDNNGNNDNHNFLVPIDLVKFVNCTLSKSSLGLSEEIQEIHYNANSFCIHIYKASTANETKLISQMIQQIINSGIVKVCVVKFSVCTILPTDLLEIVQVNKKYHDDNPDNYYLQRIELNSCKLTLRTKDSTETFNFESCDMHMQLCNNCLEVKHRYTIPRTIPFESILILIAQHAPFSDCTSLELSYHGVEDGSIITEYLNQTKLKHLCLRNTARRADQALTKIATVLKDNTTLTRLDFSGYSCPSKTGLSVVLNVLKKDENITLKYFNIEGSFTTHITNTTKKINYYTELNRIGRNQLIKTELNPLLFPFVLDKTKNNESLIYWVLRSFPNLFLSSISCQTAPKRKQQ